MKLLKLYIANFGILSDFTYTFDDKITIINEKNGFGKTTLANFIEAMFYGLEQTTKKSLDENKRRKYAPWNMQKFGGSLDFNLNDKIYRIERFFSDNKKKDTFKLIDLKLNKESNDFTDNIGLEIFKIDQDAFEKTTFFTNKEIKMNDSIRGILSEMILNTNNFGFDKASDIIMNNKSIYIKKGNKGLLPDLKNELIELNEELDVRKNDEDALKKITDELNIEKEELLINKNKMEKINQKIKNQNANLSKKTIFEQYLRLNEEVNKLDSNLYILRDQNLYLPDIESLKKAESLNMEIINLNSKIDNDIEKKNERINDLFQKNGIDDDFMNNFEEKVKNYREVNYKKYYLIELVFLVISIVFLTCAFFILNSNRIISIILFLLCFLFLIMDAFCVIFVNSRKKVNKKNNDTINNVFKLFNLDSINFQDALVELKILFNKKKEINEQYDLTVELKRELYNKKQIVSKILFGNNSDVILDNYQEQIIKMNKIAYIIDLKEKELNNKKEYLDRFVLENQIDINSNGEDIDINLSYDELKQYEKANEELIKKISSLEKIRNDLENSVNEIDNLKIRINNLDSEKKEMEYKVNVLDKALLYLEKAKNNISNNYITPMKERFIEYQKKIGGDFNNILLDDELVLKVEEKGEVKDKDFYSRGLKDLIDISLRFSLIDLLYKKERPFVILDDPFTNLDDEKTLLAKKFLEEVSDFYQIIYLTCSNSRNLS